MKTFKHVNLDFLYKVLGMELRDKSSFNIDKKEVVLKKDSLVFLVINLSYITKEFHSIPTPDILERYLSMFSHNLFFFEETIFKEYNSKPVDRSLKIKETESDSDRESNSSEGPLDYMETEVDKNFKKHELYNTQTNLPLQDFNNSQEFLGRLKINNTDCKKYEIISNGLINMSKSNKLVTLVFKVIKPINLKRTDLKKKLNKEDYLSTVGLNIIKYSHDISVLDLVTPMENLKLFEARIFHDPKIKLNLNNKMYEELEKHFSEEMNDKYSLDYLLTKCLENYKMIYK